jgi:GNAT acetyltransferase-like protein
MTPAAFKRAIRDLQVWCSSCMVAFAGAEPIGVLIGAKRPSATLIHRIAVHPDHLRQGHARHMLASIGSKLAILGPPRLVAEVPEALAAARALFHACGYVEEAHLIDYDVHVGPNFSSAESGDVHVGPNFSSAAPGRFVIPVTVDDLAANDLLGPSDAPVCWERSLETLIARKSEISGLALATDEDIEAYLLYVRDGAAAEVLALRSLADDGGSRSGQLLAQLRAQGLQSLRLPKVRTDEVSTDTLAALGFRPTGGYRVCTASARPA